MLGYVGKVRKLWKSDPQRKTRFHTENDKLCLSPRELAYSGCTWILDKCFGYRPSIPWYVPDANRMIMERDWKESTCFEYGAGYSTVWYARHFAHVYAAEHQPEWLAKVTTMVAACNNVTLFDCPDPEDYIRAIDQSGVDYFDLISIDGVHRNESFFYAVNRLRPGGFLVLDNTDVHDRQAMNEALPEHFAREDIHVFTGYPNNLLHANETTICVRR